MKSIEQNYHVGLSKETQNDFLTFYLVDSSWFPNVITHALLYKILIFLPYKEGL